MSVVLFLVSALVVFRAVTGGWKHGLRLATVALLARIEFRLDALALPIDSILGVRSTMPLLVAAHLVPRAPGRRAASLIMDSLRIGRVPVSPADMAWVRHFANRTRTFGQ